MNETGELARAVGIDLAAYRPEHVAQRVQRALARECTGGLDELTRLLRTDDDARDRFRRSLAVSVSGLFRDPDQFELLEQELLPSLLAGNRRLTIWSAACADGSELYSVALVLERLGALERTFLLGSDLLEENLAAARRGVYGKFGASRELRAKMRWERRDLLREEPLCGPWRLILCRNFAIYLAPAAKEQLFRRVAAALAPGGVLLVGRSERILDPHALGLERVHRHVYRRIAGGDPR